MPPASKSRNRRIRRAPSSDHIEEEEEEEISQRHADDVDDGEDSDQPVRKTVEKKPKIKRSNTEVPVAGPSNANRNVADEDDDDDDRIDIQNFHDQPLDKKDGGKLHGIAQDWEMIRKQIHQSSFRLVKDVAMSLADVMEGGEAGDALHEVDSIMKKLLDIDQEMRSHEDALNDLHQALMRGDVVQGILDSYEDQVKQRIDEYKTKTTRQKYASSAVYAEFKQGIYEIQHPGEAIPPIKDLVPRENGDLSDDDDELEIGGVTQDYKCPITLMILENPMTSTICGHSYSRAAIQEFLQRAGIVGKSCPASGCNKRITMDQLKTDKELEKKIKIAARRQQRLEESDEDDAEVIE